MTRNKINRNPKLNRDQLIDIQKQHLAQAKLLINHMAEAEKKIQKLEEEKEEMKELLEVAKKKIRELEEVAQKKNSDNRQTLLVADSHRKTINLKKIEEELGGKLVVVPAYNSGEWPGAKIPHKSQKIVVPLMTKKTPYTDLILQLSCNDITNIEKIQDVKLKFYLAEKSTKNTVAVAVAALKENKKLQNVLILPRSPRVDSEELKDLSEHANTVLIEAVSNSGYKEQIKLGSMSTMLTNTQEQIHEVFGSRFSPRSDGLHMRGHRGEEMYTRAILDSIRSNCLNFV